MIQCEFPHWEMVQHLTAGAPWPYPPDGAEAFCRASLESMEAGLKRHWMIRLIDHPMPIGYISLWQIDGEWDNRAFWMARAFQEQGYMQEAADRITEFAFEELGWPGLWLRNSSQNAASRRIKLKQGAVLVRTEPADYRNGPGTREIWWLSAEAWRANRTNRLGQPSSTSTRW